MLRQKKAIGKERLSNCQRRKKIKDSIISREDLDDAIANRIKLALKEQQSTLNSVVNAAVRDWMDSVPIPALRELREDIQATNKSVKELREELEAIATVAKQTHDRVESVQAAAHEDRRAVTDLRNQLERLTEKMTDMEDRSRRNNVRLVGLPEGAEGSNAVGFLRVNLSKWIPSLKGHDIEIDWAHHVYDGGRGSDRPRTLIFRVLRWHDRSEILKGAQQAYPVKCAQDNVTLLFFPDFCPATMIRRKAFGPFFFLLSTIFYFIFSHTTQHNIQNTTKQNNRHILNISRSNQKGGRERRTIKTQKSLLYIITYIKQKTLPSINGRRPGPTNSRRCTFT